MLENWCGRLQGPSRKRGPLRHTPDGERSDTQNQEKSEKRRQETPCSWDMGDTREGIPHNATHHGAT